MTKRFNIIIVLLFVPLFGLWAQKGTVEASSRADFLSKIGVATCYTFPEFVKGDVIYNTGLKTSSTLNVCAVDNSVRFLSGRDTLKLVGQEKVSHILTPEGTFLNRGGQMLLLLRDGKQWALGQRKRLSFNEPKKSEGYGAIPASSTARTSVVDDITTADNRAYGYTVSIDYRVSYDFFLIPAEGDPIRATKSSFAKCFPALKAEIKAKIKSDSLNLESEEDVISLYEFCQSHL